MIHRGFICTLVLIALLDLSCKSPKSEIQIPENVLSKDSMASLLTDIHLLEAVVDLNLSPSGVAAIQPDKYYPVFAKHHTTRTQYDSSLAYYSANIALLNSIYDEVIANLSRKQAELNKH
ncbi:MAG: DUF4296 domain-containing protein [Bacteroidia bacterium]|nr:DUF4296 domain-containing protein [Bacteroidia bacterium]